MEKEFYEGKRNALIPFVINDSVEILDGPDKGKRCTVISIEPTDNEISYLVEPGDGSYDLVVFAKSLKLI